ncbi:zinc finger MYM-type protein 5-like [Amyelois transitella]|uniref:zinc finger MYM-type protein 5-like n=1 Tax=Amyelois transitella TaxID=680683 RepID=UPI00298FE74D|nr:zinc finger MYM-type protein 5-like [Amyelois transitella]
MSERKRDYPSGAEKRKSKRKREEVIKKVPKISSFFQRQDTVSDLDWKDPSEARSASNIHSEIEESQAHTSSDVHPEIEEHQVNDSDIFEDCNIISSDRGNFGDNLSECERKIIFKLGPFKPQGPFPKDPESNRPFSAYYYSYFNQAGIKLVRPWLCYSNVLNKPYCHFCWLLADRQNKSYSSAWVNGVSVRSNFTQTILDHEKSQQHMNASLSYNNWLQGNTIDTLLQSEINSKITFWRDVLNRIINVIITLASCNLSLRGHDSDSGNFMAILRLLSNYDATLKELLLKPKGEINYLSPTIQNEIISLLGTTVRNNIISEI